MSCFCLPTCDSSPSNCFITLLSNLHLGFAGFLLTYLQRTKRLDISSISAGNVNMHDSTLNRTYQLTNPYIQYCRIQAIRDETNSLARQYIIKIRSWGFRIPF